MITLIQTVIFVSYIAFIWYRFGGPLKSISDSWYKLEEPTRWLFLVFAWSLGATMLFEGVETTALFFLSAIGLFFLGAAPQFKWKITNTVHYLGAVTAILGALFALGFGYAIWWPLIVWLASVAAIRLLKVNNATWWIEIAAFLVIIAGLLQR